MNSLTFMRAIKYISLFILISSPLLAYANWKVDFSRRANQMNRGPASVDGNLNQEVPSESSLMDQVFKSVLPTQEIVILNTEKGFVPSTVRVREGALYKVVVVNVNEKARNVSFVLDSFSEHHATFYGQIKSFQISPKREGVFTFVSPETSAQGRLVVHPALDSAPGSMDGLEIRAPASRD